MSTFDTLRSLANAARPGQHVYVVLHFSDRILMHRFADARLHDASATIELVEPVNATETRVRYFPASAPVYVTVEIRDQSLEDMMSDMAVEDEG